MNPLFTSIRGKILAMMIVISIVIVSVAGISFIHFFRQSTIEEFQVALAKDARIVGDNCQVALVFDLRDDAKNILNSLRHQPSIQFAGLYRPEGVLFSSYGLAPESLPFKLEAKPFQRVAEKAMWVSLPIFVKDELQGYIVVQDNLQALNETMARTARTLLFILSISLVLAILVGWRIQGLISQPLERLVTTTTDIRKTQDYTRRAEVINEDEVGKLVVAFNDMLDEIEARNAKLQASEERFRALTENTTDFTWILSSADAVIYASPNTHQVLGAPNEAGGYDNFVNTVAAKDRNVWRDAVSMVNEPGTMQPLSRIEISTIDGKTCLIEGRLTNMTHVAGVGGIVFNGRDVTDASSLENQLQHAQKMEAIGHLAGGVAHDFNNLLGGIMGMADLMTVKLNDRPELKEMAERIVGTSERAAELTQQLLAYSRKNQMEMIPLDVKQLVGDVIQILNHTIDRKVSIESALDASDRVVRGDLTHLQNALVNLGVNARDAMLPKGGTLTFSTYNADFDEAYCQASAFDVVPGRYVVIEVSDTGSGMSKEIVSRIFEPFFTTKEVGKGTGLGLAAVYGTTKSHKGSIEVYSEEGVGTSFKVALPVTGASFAQGKGGGECDMSPLNAKVLVIDDEDIIRAMVEPMLATLGCRVVSVASGPEGLNRLREVGASFDVILLDMIMPHMRGDEVLAEIRKTHPDMPVVIASGFSEGEALEEMRRLGIQGFIRKPFITRDLAACLREVLG